MSAISISRQYGAGGSVVAGLVADRLGYQLVDQAILDEVAREARISIDWVRQMEREAGDWMARLVPKILANKNFVHYLPGTSTKFDEPRYRAFLQTVIAHMGGRGRVVILGRGAQFVLKSNPAAIRVLLIAEEADRIDSLMARYRLGRAKAVAIARDGEKRRLSFLRAFEAGEPDESRLYHLVINTSLISHQEAAELVCRLVK